MSASKFVTLSVDKQAYTSKHFQNYWAVGPGKKEAKIETLLRFSLNYVACMRKQRILSMHTSLWESWIYVCTCFDIFKKPVLKMVALSPCNALVTTLNEFMFLGW